MLLARIGPPGEEIPAAIGSDGIPRSLVGTVEDISGKDLAAEGIKRLAGLEIDSLPRIPAPYRYGPCIGGTSQIICVGLNYVDHARESGMDIPEEPILFMKSPSAICGPNDDITIPRGAEKVDWEVELAVIIGRRCSYVDEAQAHEYIAGYCILNDISERAFQLEGTGQWVKGKSADTFAPLGPWLVTPDEIENVHDLSLWLKVNDETLQSSNTGQMIFRVNELVSYISRFMTLGPGDIISTGTPFGVGLGLTPPRYLRPGDRMSLGISGLGIQEQTTVEWSCNQIPG